MKKIASVLLGVCLALSVAIMPAEAGWEKLDNKGNITLNGPVYTGDFIEFVRATSNPKIKHYTVTLHTPGGDAITTVAICNRIKEMKRNGIKFTMKVYGFSMSAGSYIFLLGDERIMYEGSYLMWHTIQAQQDPYAWERNRKSNPGIINLFTGLDNYMRRLFKEVTGSSDASVKAWLDGGKAQFMSAETAYNIGIATKYVAAK